MMRLARHARDKGVGVEIDMTTHSSLRFTVETAHRVVKELKMPVRLAIAARYKDSEKVLRDWIALGKQTGVKVGVRLVKGSFVESEGDGQGVINERKPLMEQYKKVISQALASSKHLDIAVATQNEDIFNHAQAESSRLAGDYSVHVIRGVNPEVQAKMQAAGKISRVYISYGVDAPVFGLTELLTNARERRAISKKHQGNLD
jgi:hypothetical protein